MKGAIFNRTIFLQNLQLRQSFPRNLSSKVSISVKQGIVVGREDKLPNGETFCSFKGIPYAVQPTGTLRFQDPQPLNKFPVNELDCSKERDISIQINPFTRKIVGSEECLHLNVYTPQLKSTLPLPVMVWIHGGSNTNGSGNSDYYHPLYLLQENVVVVTINYRVGVFGFLSLPEHGVPGNAGLKDQLIALKWINENIHEFNGDPTNVTLFGQSSGAAHVHFHVLSDISQKYFHKAIIQSGTATQDYIIESDPNTKAHHLANLLNFKGSDDEIVNFLKNQKPEILIEKQMDVVTAAEKRREFPIPFKCVIEPKSENALITGKTHENLKISNKINVPIMMGYTNREGLLFLAANIRKINSFENDLSRLVPMRMNLDDNHFECLNVTEKIRQFYFNGGKINEDSIENFCDLLGDYYMNNEIFCPLELHLKYQNKFPLYFYRFSYDGDLNMYKKWYKCEKFKGASHGDDMCYLFQMELMKKQLKMGSEAETITRRMCRMWANFAKFSNPTATKDELIDYNWEPVKSIDQSGNDKFDLNFLDINSNTRMEQNPDKDRREFWRELYKQYTS